MQRKHPELTMIFQQTVTTPLKLCLSPGVHPNPFCSVAYEQTYTSLLNSRISILR